MGHGRLHRRARPGCRRLLNGYRATTHWQSLELLPLVGATPVAERVVVDRNRVTGGGITAGIDFGLALAGALHGREVAEKIQLVMEYAPAPPSSSGSPATADPQLVRQVSADRRALFDQRRASLLRRQQQQVSGRAPVIAPRRKRPPVAVAGHPNSSLPSLSPKRSVGAPRRSSIAR